MKQEEQRKTNRRTSSKTSYAKKPSSSRSTGGKTGSRQGGYTGKAKVTDGNRTSQRRNSRTDKSDTSVGYARKATTDHDNNRSSRTSGARSTFGRNRPSTQARTFTRGNGEGRQYHGNSDTTSHHDFKGHNTDSTYNGESGVRRGRPSTQGRSFNRNTTGEHQYRGNRDTAGRDGKSHTTTTGGEFKSFRHTDATNNRHSSYAGNQTSRGYNRTDAKDGASATRYTSHRSDNSSGYQQDRKERYATGDSVKRNYAGGKSYHNNRFADRNTTNEHDRERTEHHDHGRDGYKSEYKSKRSTTGSYADKPHYHHDETSHRTGENGYHRDHTDYHGKYGDHHEGYHRDNSDYHGKYDDRHEGYHRENSDYHGKYGDHREADNRQDRQDRRSVGNATSAPKKVKRWGDEHSYTMADRVDTTEEFPRSRMNTSIHDSRAERPTAKEVISQALTELHSLTQDAKNNTWVVDNSDGRRKRKGKTLQNDIAKADPSSDDSDSANMNTTSEIVDRSKDIVQQMLATATADAQNDNIDPRCTGIAPQKSLKAVKNASVAKHADKSPIVTKKTMARMVAVQMLYQLLLQQEENPHTLAETDASMAAKLLDAFIDSGLAETCYQVKNTKQMLQKQLYTELVCLVAQDYEKILQQQSELLADNNFTNLNLISQSIILLGIVEIEHFPDTPVKVIINEYLDIANCFLEKGQTSLINGVLDKVAKNIAEHKTNSEVNANATV